MPVKSVGAIVADHAARKPDAPAITFEDATLTWAAFDRATNRMARAYGALGVKHNDLVTIALPNSIEFYIAAFAVWKLGATPQPVSAKLPKRELEAIVELVDPPIVIGVDAARIPDRTALPPGFAPDPDLSDDAFDYPVARHFKAPTSGGSTGRPKIIVSEQPGEFDPLEPRLHMEVDRAVLVPGPLYHNAPFLTSSSALIHGNHIVVMPRFDAEEALRLFERHRIDYVQTVPTMMLRIWRLGPEVRAKYDLSALRIMVHMAAPCPPWLKEAWIEWLGPEVVCELYGGTEAQSFTWITGTEWLAHRGSVGKPLEGGRMKVVDPDGVALPPGEVGEIYMLPDEGQGATYHYIGADPKADADGWESLGDLGWMDEDGYLYLSDRLKDMILSGGANIYPAEVEGALESHPAVRSCAVIGLPDEDLGQRVHAICEIAEDVIEDDLVAHLSEYLVRYKIPRSFEFTREPVRDDAGKVRRSALRDQRAAQAVE